jgi:Mg/Co/Ni transporter MgtE
MIRTAAGNQSAIAIIRALATGAIRPTAPHIAATLREQAAVGLLLGGGLAAGGFVRVFMSSGEALSAAAIALSLFLIVTTSVVVGAALPFLLVRNGIDPANGGTLIQVLMDVGGCLFTCVACKVVLVTMPAALGLLPEPAATAAVAAGVGGGAAAAAVTSIG